MLDRSLFTFICLATARGPAQAISPHILHCASELKLQRRTQLLDIGATEALWDPHQTAHNGIRVRSVLIRGLQNPTQE